MTAASVRPRVECLGQAAREVDRGVTGWRSAVTGVDEDAAVLLRHAPMFGPPGLLSTSEPPKPSERSHHQRDP